MTQPGQTLEEIFQEACDLPGDAERAAMLERACAGDPDLRARVERLLAAVPKVGSFLEGPAFAPTGGDCRAELPAQVDMSGKRVGPYLLVEKLGEGGMGVVYLAEQQQPVRRRVALKIIRRGLDSPQSVARFEQERAALALMDHPHIARVLDAGTTGDGRPYFVMELVQGIPITQYCDQERLHIRDRIALFVPVCRAVQHAHQKGIIHRDLKPSNVIVGLYDGQAIPKVIDFGVAKVTGPRLTDRTMVTEAGQIVGTMEYMAPEQAEMGNHDVDTRSDIYSLGVVLYELLTGAMPFAAADLRSMGLSEMLRIIRDVEPKRPSTRISSVADLAKTAANRRAEPNQLAGLLKGELDWITLKCLEKDRSRRYDSATGLANDLERYLADEPVLACPPSGGYRLRKLARRYKYWIAAASAFLVLLIVAIIAQAFALVAVDRERTAKVAALQAEARRREQVQVALDAMTSNVIEDWLSKQPVLLPEHKKFLEKALGYYEDFSRDTGQDESSRVSVAQAHQRVGTILINLGRFEDAIAAYRRSSEIYDALTHSAPGNPEYAQQVAVSHREMGYALAKLGRFAEAESQVRGALEIQQPLVASHPQDASLQRELSLSLDRLGVLLKNLGRLQEAEAETRRALAIRQRSVDSFPKDQRARMDLARTYMGLGNLLNAFPDRKSGAITAHRKAVGLLEELAAEFPAEILLRQELAIAASNLGQAILSDDRPAEAEPFLLRSLRLAEELAASAPAVPEFQRSVAIALSNLGIAYKDSERWQQAEDTYRRALEIHTHLADRAPKVPDHQNEVAGAIVNLARIHLIRGAPTQARDLLVQGLPHHKAALQANPGNRSYRNFYRLNRWRLAESLVALHDHAAASEVIAEFLQAATERPRDTYTAACLLAACAADAEKDSQLSHQEQQDTADVYRGRAISALRQAVQEGYHDVLQLRSDPFLDPLRSDSAFPSVLQSLEQDTEKGSASP